MNLLEQFNRKHQETLRAARQDSGHWDPRAFSPGDTVCVHVRVREGERERIQRFEGVCIAKRNKGLQSCFLVRRVTSGFGVERVFPLFHPNIERVECLRRGKVRRAKLYYLRHLSGKKARITEKRDVSPRTKHSSTSSQPALPEASPSAS